MSLVFDREAATYEGDAAMADAGAAVVGVFASNARTLRLVRGGKYGVGRTPGANNDIVVRDAKHVSSRHLQVVCGDDGRVELKDLSTNGTYVNDVQVGKNQLSDAHGNTMVDKIANPTLAYSGGSLACGNPSVVTMWPNGATVRKPAGSSHLGSSSFRLKCI